jgi:hypothetical protein
MAVFVLWERPIAFHGSEARSAAQAGSRNGTAKPVEKQGVELI